MYFLGNLPAKPYVQFFFVFLLPERELISVFGKKLYQHMSKLDPPYRVDGMEFGLKHCMIAAWMSKSGLYFVNIQKKLKISGKGDFQRWNMCMKH